MITPFKANFPSQGSNKDIELSPTFVGDGSTARWKCKYCMFKIEVDVKSGAVLGFHPDFNSDHTHTCDTVTNPAFNALNNPNS